MTIMISADPHFDAIRDRAANALHLFIQNVRGSDGTLEKKREARLKIECLEGEVKRASTPQELRRIASDFLDFVDKSDLTLHPGLIVQNELDWFKKLVEY